MGTNPKLTKLTPEQKFVAAKEAYKFPIHGAVDEVIGQPVIFLKPWQAKILHLTNHKFTKAELNNLKLSVVTYHAEKRKFHGKERLVRTAKGLKNFQLTPRTCKLILAKPEEVTTGTGKAHLAKSVELPIPRGLHKADIIHFFRDGDGKGAVSRMQYRGKMSDVLPGIRHEEPAKPGEDAQS